MEGMAAPEARDGRKHCGTAVFSEGLGTGLVIIAARERSMAEGPGRRDTPRAPHKATVVGSRRPCACPAPPEPPSPLEAGKIEVVARHALLGVEMCALVPGRSRETA